MFKVEEASMLDLGVSWLQFFVIAVANFLLSWLYYSPAAPWFKAWALGVGMDPAKREMTEEEKKAMPGLMSGALLTSRFEGKKPKVLLINNCLYLPTYAVLAAWK
jgi:hypothetical protein